MVGSIGTGESGIQSLSLEINGRCKRNREKLLITVHFTHVLIEWILSVECTVLQEGFKLLVVVSDFDFVKRELVSVLASDWDPLAVSEEFSSPRLVKGVTRGDATLAVSARIKHGMRGGGPKKSE